MRDLPDVNVLVALFDEDHIFNDQAHAWLETKSKDGIATCPLTENGLIRILSHPNYSAKLRHPPAQILRRLDLFCSQHDHAFWPDELSLRQTNLFQIDRLLGPRQVTDAYLLALAVRHNGRLVTFDTGIPSTAVLGALPQHLLVI